MSYIVQQKGSDVMIRIAVVEDEAESTELIKHYLSRYEKEKKETFEVDYFSNGLDFLDDYHPNYDIVFMDILMPHINGMDTAKKLRRIDNDVCLIFITSMAQYAINGYEVNAVDFILKPVGYVNFSSKLQKTIGRLSRQKDKRICVTIDGMQKFISAKDVMYIEVQGHNLSFHLADGETLITRGKLDLLETELSAHHFYRTYKSYLINLNYVKEVKLNSVIVGDADIIVSRSRKKDFMRKLADFLGG